MIRTASLGVFARRSGSSGAEYTDAWAMFGLKRMISGYIGPLVKVRRSSDNVEANIYPLSGGGFNTAAVLAHCGSGDGFVSIWYDQSGGGHNLIQETTGNQPKIVSAGTYLSNILFDGITDSMGTLTSGPAVVNWSIAMRLTAIGAGYAFSLTDEPNEAAAGADGSMIYSSASPGLEAVRAGPAGYIGFGDYFVRQFAGHWPIGDDTLFMVAAATGATPIVMRKNGVQLSSSGGSANGSEPGTFSAPRLVIGARGLTSSQRVNINFKSVILYPMNKLADAALIEALLVGTGAPLLANVQASFSGHTGGLYDCTNINTLWADTSRTTPATVGNPVRGITDLSGNGVHLSTSATTHLLQVDENGVYYINCPGNVDGFTSAFGPLGSASGHSMVAAYRAANHTAAMALIAVDYSSTGRVTNGLTLKDGANAGGLYAQWFRSPTPDRRSVAEVATRAASVKHVASGVFDTGVQSLYLDGSVVATTTDTGFSFLAPSAASVTLACAYFETSSPSFAKFAGRMYCATFISKPLNDTERMAFESYFTAKMNGT